MKSSNTIDRRSFVSAMVATGTAALLLPRSVKAADSRVEILVNEPIGRVHPDVYSHFVEHLGGVVYDGIWVGEKSKIPNYGGLRKDLVDNLKKLKPGVIRYPGGCFADQYDWRDGIGPREKRPARREEVRPHPAPAGSPSEARPPAPPGARRSRRTGCGPRD